MTDDSRTQPPTLLPVRLLTLVLAAFGCWAWLTHYALLPQHWAPAAGGVLLSGICVVAQWLCNTTAAEAGRAHATKRSPLLIVLLTALTCGFGFVSAIGLHHGWQIVSVVAPDMGVSPLPSAWMTGLFFFLAFAEPAKYWASMLLSHPVEQSAPNLNKAPATPYRPTTRTHGTAVAAGLVATMAVGGHEPAAPPPQPAATMRTTTARRATTRPRTNRLATAHDAAVEPTEAQARALFADGWSERRIATRLGLTRHRVRRALGKA